LSQTSAPCIHPLTVRVFGSIVTSLPNVRLFGPDTSRIRVESPLLGKSNVLTAVRALAVSSAFTPLSRSTA
jgi:hypothetical protein